LATRSAATTAARSTELEQRKGARVRVRELIRALERCEPGALVLVDLAPDFVLRQEQRLSPASEAGARVVLYTLPPGATPPARRRARRRGKP
jgi:hypothetical protein